MTRTRIALTLATLGVAGLLALTGCGVRAGNTGTAATAAGADVSDEATALQAVGFNTGLAAEPAPSGSAERESGTQRKDRRIAIRKYLRKNTLHGEVTVQGKDGVKTIVVQRGTVTAATATGMTVKSTDGFALTWTFGDKLRLVQDRKTVTTGALKVGQEVGVAGTRDGGAASARLIAIR
jgi:hypothetical protein